MDENIFTSLIPNSIRTYQSNAIEKEGIGDICHLTSILAIAAWNNLDNNVDNNNPDRKSRWIWFCYEKETREAEKKRENGSIHQSVRIISIDASIRLDFAFNSEFNSIKLFNIRHRNDNVAARVTEMNSPFDYQFHFLSIFNVLQIFNRWGSTITFNSFSFRWIHSNKFS